MSECPEENEFGVRNDPVCVDEVDTSRYQNITGGFSLNPSSSLTSAQLISVSITIYTSFTLSEWVRTYGTRQLYRHALYSIINRASTTPSVKIKPSIKYSNTKLLAYKKIKHLQKHLIYTVYCMFTHSHTHKVCLTIVLNLLQSSKV